MVISRCWNTWFVNLALVWVYMFLACRESCEFSLIWKIKNKKLHVHHLKIKNLRVPQAENRWPNQTFFTLSNHFLWLHLLPWLMLTIGHLRRYKSDCFTIDSVLLCEHQSIAMCAKKCILTCTVAFFIIFGESLKMFFPISHKFLHHNVPTA